MSHFNLEHMIWGYLQSLNNHPVDDYEAILELSDVITTFYEETLPTARRHCLEIEDLGTLEASLYSNKISHEREIVWLMREREYGLVRRLIKRELKWIENQKLVSPILEKLYLEVVRLHQQLQQLLLAAGAPKKWVKRFCTDHKIDKSLLRRRPYCDAQRFIDSKVMFKSDPGPEILETVDALICTWNQWRTEYEQTLTTTHSTRRREFLLRMQELSTYNPNLTQFITTLLQ